VVAGPWFGIRRIFLNRLSISAYGDVAPITANPYNPAAAREREAAAAAEGAVSVGRVAIAQPVVLKGNNFLDAQTAQFRPFVTSVTSTRERCVKRRNPSEFRSMLGVIWVDEIGA
jgi:hypothetical protein